MNKRNRLQENALSSDRIFIMPLSTSADEEIKELGYSKSGFVYDCEVSDLRNILENADVEEDELKVKNEDGEPIEDLYSLAFDSDDDYEDGYDDYEDDDEVYFEPGEGDEYFLDDEDDF